MSAAYIQRGSKYPLVSHIERLVRTRHVAEREIGVLVIGGPIYPSGAVSESFYVISLRRTLATSATRQAKFTQNVPLFKASCIALVLGEFVRLFMKRQLLW